ncbi:ankyrin repeat-containing domain protein, partial [Pyronema domesticum]
LKPISSRSTADINAIDSRGRTALAAAAISGHIDIVRALLKRTDLININSVDLDGKTPLILASARGFSDIVYALLERPEIDVNHVDNNRYSAL